MVDSYCKDSTTLFWETVPFICKAPEKDDFTKQLTVRIIQEQKQKNKVLRVNISCESDSLFLHSLEVTEDDYARLKFEQGILVDFESFPQKLISLFKRCICDAPKFIVELKTAVGNQSEVQFIETNDFNKLSHLRLSFRPGSDLTIKSHLAFRLQEVMEESKTYKLQLHQAQLDISEMSEKMREKEALVKDLKEKCETVIKERLSDEKKLMLEWTEKASYEKEEMRTVFEAEKQQLEKKLIEQIESLASRNLELEEANKRLLDEKYTVDAKCAELLHQLAMAKGETNALTADTSELRKRNELLVSENQELKVTCTQNKAECKAQSQKVLDIEEVVELQKGRICDLEASRKTWELRYQEQHNQVTSQEESQATLVRELNEQQTIAKTLALKLRSARDKSLHQKAILSEQDHRIISQEKKLKENLESRSSLENKFKTLQDNCDSKDGQIQQLKVKCMESAKQLEDSELTIKWLNDQLNTRKAKKSSILGKSSLIHSPFSRTVAFGRKGRGISESPHRDDPPLTKSHSDSHPTTSIYKNDGTNR